MNYSKKRAIAQTTAPSLKYISIENNTTLTIKDLEEKSYKGNQGEDVPNDQLICVKEDGKNIKVPMREFLKMNLKSGGNHYESQNNSDEIKLPTSFTILSGEDRKDNKERTVYPVYAYKLADDFLKEGSAVDYEELVAGGLKDDNTFAPVQNYLIELS